MATLDAAERRPTLLIVDDDLEVLGALAFMADARGFDVRGCRSAREALADADRDGAVACFIIDQRLPDMRGVDLLAALRLRGVDAPAILMTTAPSADLQRRAADAGAPIVEKPLLDETLFTQIERLLGAD